MFLYKKDASLGASVTRIMAADADSEENGQLFFRIVTIDPINLPFVINTTSGVISVAGPLDRETESRYTVSWGRRVSLF